MLLAPTKSNAHGTHAYGSVQSRPFSSGLDRKPLRRQQSRKFKEPKMAEDPEVSSGGEISRRRGPLKTETLSLLSLLN